MRLTHERKSGNQAGAGRHAANERRQNAFPPAAFVTGQLIGRQNQEQPHRKPKDKYHYNICMHWITSVDPSIAGPTQKVGRIGSDYLCPFPPLAGAFHATVCAHAKKRQLFFTAAVYLCRRVFRALYRAYIFFCLETGRHQFMAAGQAFQAKIRTGTQYLPGFAAAGMRLFHG